MAQQRVRMDTVMHESLSLNDEELDILTELLVAERDKLLVEVRHTDHRSFREELRHRREIIERLLERVGAAEEA
jgi:hypothetical protein